MKAITWKEVGESTLLGVAVVVGTPLLASALQGISFLATKLPVFNLDIATVVSAGVIAFGADMLITQTLRK